MPRRQELDDQSVKRQPTASSTSADAASSLPDVDAVSPTLHAFSSWVSSMAPLPCQVVTTAAPEPLGQRGQLVRGSRQQHAAPGHDHRPAGVAQERRGSLDVVGGRARAVGRFALLGVRDRDVGRLDLHVHRQVEQHRAGTAGKHLVPRALQHEGQLVDPGRLPPLLDDRLEDARVVGLVAALDLLEEPVAAHVGVGGAGHQQHGRRVGVGRGHAHDGVGLPRTDAREGQQRPARDPEVAVRDVHRRLLVHHLDRADLLRVVEEHVGQRPAAVAGDPERHTARAGGPGTRPGSASR